MKTRKKVRYNNSADSTIEKEPENDLVKKASSDKSRGRTLARHLRKSGQLVSLNADVASVIAEYAGLSVQIQKALDTGKKSLEKAILGSQDGINAAQNISGNSAAICEYTVEMYEAIEYLHHIFEDNAHEINQLIETVNSIAKATNETQKSIEGLKKSYDKSDEFVSDIINIGEVIDVAGLNASLEAGRSGKPLAGYTIIAEKIQKTAELYEKAAVGFNDLISDIQQRIGETGVKINDIVEKIRTVTVMSKGVKSAYNDITSEFAELENMAEGISELADEVLSENNMVTAFDAYIETAEYILPIFDNTKAASVNRDGMFTEAAEQSELLSKSTAKLATEQNFSSALDDILTAADNLMDVTEQVDDDLETTIQQLSGLSGEIEELENNAEYIGEKLEATSQFTAGVTDNTENIKIRLESVQQNITESINAAIGIKNEFESMIDENKSFNRHIREIQRSACSITDYINTFKGFATILECISLNGALEVARAQQESGFSSIPKRCESIAEELTDKLKQLKLFADTFEQNVDNLGFAANVIYIDKITEPIIRLQEDLNGLQNRDISPLYNNIEKIAETARDLEKIIGSMGANSKELISLSESTADKAQKVSESAVNQQSSLKKALEYCEKIQAQAEELYPAEE